MSLTLQELLGWPREIQDLAGATREAAANHSNSANFYRSLTKFSSWQGDGADAAKAAMEAAAGEHDATAESLGKGAAVMDHAADEAEGVANTIKSILNDAAARPAVEINPSTNQVISPDTRYMTEEYAKQVAAKVTDLQERIAAALAAGEAVDADLASAIKTATGADDPMPGDSRPEIHDALSKPLPEDPKQFTDLWNKLTDEEKEWLYQRDHFIGNHPGMPFIDKNRFNERHLPELTAIKQAEIDRLARERPGWAAGGRPTTANPNPPDYQEWKKQWDAAHRSLDGYNAVNAEMQKFVDADGDGINDVPRFLANIDDQGRAAIALNNPDTADNVATFVPGMNSRLDGIGGDVVRSERLLEAATKADPLARTSVVTWYDYNAPQDLAQAASTSSANAGAPRLDAFQDGLRASHEGMPSHNTIVAHSYGTLVTGTAAGHGDGLAVNDIVLAGSPGIGVQNVTELRLDGVNPADNRSHVFATASPMDPVPRIGSVFGNLAHGPNPVSDSFGATTFDGNWGWPWNAHSNYWELDNPALTTQGEIITGSGPS